MDKFRWKIFIIRIILLTTCIVTLITIKSYQYILICRLSWWWHCCRSHKWFQGWYNLHSRLSWCMLHNWNILWFIVVANDNNASNISSGSYTLANTANMNTKCVNHMKTIWAIYIVLYYIFYYFKELHQYNYNSQLCQQCKDCIFKYNTFSFKLMCYNWSWDKCLVNIIIYYNCLQSNWDSPSILLLLFSLL